MGEVQRKLRLSPGVPCFAPHWRNIATHGQVLGTDLHASVTGRMQRCAVAARLTLSATPNVVC